jgi:DNA-binding MarR family transcriptional regulator
MMRVDLDSYSSFPLVNTMPAKLEKIGRRVLEERLSSPGLLLALLGHVAMRRLRDAHTAHNLTPRQFHLLGLLHDHGAMGQQKLGLKMGTDPSILVTMLNPLEVDGLISRERAPDDRRRHLVTLTSAGEQQLIRAARAQHEAEAALFAGLDHDQREQLRLLLVALQDSLADGHETACSLAADGDECQPTAKHSHAPAHA